MDDANIGMGGVKEQLGDIANLTIIGLAEGPWDDPSEFSNWPTGGYDEALFGFKWSAKGAFAQSGWPREDWVALADEMIARWTAWKAHVQALPDE